MSVQGLTARSVTTGDAAEFLCFVGTLIYCVFLQFEFFLRSVTRISIHSVNYKMLNNCYVQRKKNLINWCNCSTYLLCKYGGSGGD